MPFTSTSLLLAGEKFAIWHAADIDPFLDELLSRGPDDPEVLDERLPYWAQLWPSAVGLAEWILGQSGLTGKTVCELGCGPGLPGIAAARMGADVLWTDIQPRALELTAANALANGIPGASTAVLDWREPPTDQRFDILLAADVAYEARAFDPLVHCLKTLLAPGGQIWISEPLRPVARPFFSLLKEQGFTTHRTTLQIPWEGRNVDIQILSNERVT